MLLILEQQPAAVSQPHGSISEIRQPLQFLGFQRVDSESIPIAPSAFRRSPASFRPSGDHDHDVKPRAELGRHYNRLRRLLLPRLRDFHDEGTGVGNGIDQTLAIRRPDGEIDERSRRVGEPLQSAAIGVDQPDVIFAAAVGLKGDAPAVRRPAGVAVLVNIVCELPESGSIRLDDEDVFLLASFPERQPFAVRREIGDIWPAVSPG